VVWFGSEQRHRVPLPTYPFERQRYWIERAGEPSQGEIKLAKGQISLTGFMFLPGNEYPGRNATCHVCGNSVMLSGFVDECGLGEQIAQRLEQAGQDVIAWESNLANLIAAHTPSIPKPG